jgi:hypothetical protein
LPTDRDYDPTMTDQRALEHEPKPSDQPEPEKQPSDYNDPVDEAADESFPASDPPSSSGATATREPDDGQRDR